MPLIGFALFLVTLVFVAVSMFILKRSGRLTRRAFLVVFSAGFMSSIIAGAFVVEFKPSGLLMLLAYAGVSFSFGALAMVRRS